MSVERMRILLGLDTVNNYNFLAQRQQITPDIRFTCECLQTVRSSSDCHSLQNDLYTKFVLLESILEFTLQ